MGKTGRENRRYSTEFKICVIMDMREHKLSYKETVRKYWEGSKGKEANHVKQIQLVGTHILGRRSQRSDGRTPRQK